MNGELRYERRFGRDVPVVWYSFDADDCEAIASVMGRDGWADDLREDAAELRTLAEPVGSEQR